MNDFHFTTDFVRELYLANIRAGIDYMEFGYKADKTLFDINQYGRWKFCDDDDIYAITGENNTSLKVCVMVDVGRCAYENDIRLKAGSPIDMIRVATYMDQIPEAVKIIENAAGKGYQVSCNIMAISKADIKDIKRVLKILGQLPIEVVYVSDSYGVMYPDQVRRMTDLFCQEMHPVGKATGIHAHNNQQCAFINTIEAMNEGAEYLDASVCGMGRGAGNCSMEGLIGYLRQPEYQLEPILEFIEKHMPDMQSKYVWGYDIPYLLTGLMNRHPRMAIEAVKNNDRDYMKLYQLLCRD